MGSSHSLSCKNKETNDDLHDSENITKSKNNNNKKCNNHSHISSKQYSKKSTRNDKKIQRHRYKTTHINWYKPRQRQRDNSTDSYCTTSDVEISCTKQQISAELKELMENHFRTIIQPYIIKSIRTELISFAISAIKNEADRSGVCIQNFHNACSKCNLCIQELQPKIKQGDKVKLSDHNSYESRNIFEVFKTKTSPDIAEENKRLDKCTDTKLDDLQTSCSVIAKCQKCLPFQQICRHNAIGNSLSKSLPMNTSLDNEVINSKRHSSSCSHKQLDPYRVPANYLYNWYTNEN